MHAWSHSDAVRNRVYDSVNDSSDNVGDDDGSDDKDANNTNGEDGFC